MSLRRRSPPKSPFDWPAALRSLAVRPAVLADAHAIGDLEFAVWNDAEPPTAHIDLCNTIRYGWAYVATVQPPALETPRPLKERVVGAILATATARGSVLIADIVVAPPVRRQKIAMRLLRRLLPATEGHAVFGLVDEGNVASRALLESYGFRNAGRIADPYAYGDGSVSLEYRRP